MSSRRVPVLTVLLLGLTFLGASTVAYAQTSSQQDAAEEQGQFPWHLVNSVIFFAGFAFAVWKYSPAFFNARSEDIQKAIKDATGLKMQADFRYSEMDRKIATLPAEIERMRGESTAAMDREEQRRREELNRELQHIESSLQAEVEASRQEGVRRIRRQAALLALRSAEQQLQGRAASGQTGAMVGDFLQLVERGKRS